MRGSSTQWLRPSTLEELLRLRAEHLGAKLVAGNTEVGIEAKFKGMISESSFPRRELHGKSVSKRMFWRLAGRDAVPRRVLLETEPEDCGFRAMRWTCCAGSPALRSATWRRSRATLSVSPISDMNPVLIGLGATFVLQSAARGERRVAADAFFRRTAQWTSQRMRSSRASRSRALAAAASTTCARVQAGARRDDDISTANACMKVSVKGDVVQEAVVAFGGMAPTAVRARAVEEALVGSVFDLDIDFGSALKKDVGPPEVRRVA